MKRYIPSSRSRSNDSIQAEFLHNLNGEAQKLLTQLSRQFLKDLETQTTQILRASTEGLQTGSSSSSGDGSSGNFGRIASSIVRYLVTRPDQTSTSVTQSARSQAVEAEFRLSQSQAMAEAGQAVARGNKNL